MILGENLEETKVPILKVKIRRRKSNNEKFSDNPFLKTFLKASVEPKVSLPKVEVLYETQIIAKDEGKSQISCSKCRPPTSPISVILKSQEGSQDFKKIVRSRLKELPKIKKKDNLNTKDIIIAGNSVKYYDWLSTFLNFPTFAKENLLSEKAKQIRLSSIPQRIKSSNNSMKKRLLKSKYKVQARFFSKIV